MKTTFTIAERGRNEQLPLEDASRVGAVRRLAKAHLNYRGLTCLSDDVALIVSELVSNAVLHSNGTTITVKLLLQNGCLHIAVRDEMPGRPVIRAPDDDEESGRGLQLVERLSEDHGGAWGTSADGTTTWCTLAVPEARR
ncbi:ATP-binding protein [Streptomyces sp. NPDC003077]|uniref:ATP-binding protein n=1 Tax=Streptomyces sp. NPDC003077 TaxID=3154443 RepID=UPI0033AD390C